MPQASFDLGGGSTVQTMTAAPIIVAIYDPTSEEPFFVLPNVRCLRIDYREGPSPPVARFQYIMSNLLDANMGWPSQFERLWPIDAQGDYIVQCDDRIVVYTQRPPATADAGPTPYVMFDGFAQIPQVDLAGGRQAVSFVAIGVAIRLWDKPIEDRWQRDAVPGSPTDGNADYRVQLPCRFNPADTAIGSQGGYMGNCVPTGEYTTIGEDTFPVFLDPLVIERGGPVGGFDTSFWFVSDAMSYLIAKYGSPSDDAGFVFVNYPAPSSMASLLSCLAPPTDTGPVNPKNAVSSDIMIRDYDGSNKAVPDVMAELLQYCGFVLVYTTTTDNDGQPMTSMKLLRRDGLSTQAPKILYLGPAGSPFNLGANNAVELHLARDTNDVANQWTVETALQQFEITVTLAPGFTPSSTDQPPTFFKANLTNVTASEARKYRWWIADECGDGHWNSQSASWVTDEPLDLSGIMPPVKNVFPYVFRYRPGSSTLISKDVNGAPLKAVLEYLAETTAGDPAISDAALPPALTIPHGAGWRLLDDRLGIEVTVDNPDDWHFKATNPLAGGAAAGATQIQAFTWLSNPAPATNFTLRLTTVIEGDVRIPYKDVTASARVASPNAYNIERSIDSKDHFQYCVIAKNSLHYTAQGGDGSAPYVARDDTKAARTHAQQLRAAHEFPTLAGSATVPYLTDFYQIGDRVKIVQGRNASLQINVGVDQGEAPSYPWITAFSWILENDRQQTVLQFSDRRAEPQSV
jgi:hypothetical protein